MKFSEKVTNGINIVAAKVSSNKYINAIKDAFIINMPLIFAGSFATLFSSVLCNPKSGLAQFAAFSFLADYASLFSTINYACLNFIAIYICYFIASELAKVNGVDVKFTGILAVASYVIVIPTSTSILVDNKPQIVNNIIANTSTNAQGLFLAIIIGIVATEIFSKLMKSDKLLIKMPDSVPEGICKSFASVIPTILTLLIISFASFVFIKISGMNLSDAIFKMLQKPLEGVMQNPFGILIIVLVSQIFWFFGLHGANIIAAIKDPILLAALATNMNLVASGQDPTNIVARPFWYLYCIIGGSGCTIGLLIAIFIASKREDYRSVGKLAFIPALFNINEPVIFGIPIVLNPTLGIPFILAPLVSASIAYFATYVGFAGIGSLDVPWTTPAFINGFLSTRGSIGAVITQAICIIASVLIYLPFVKMANKQVNQNPNELQDNSQSV